MERKTDLRVIKTFNKLAFALRDMLTEGSFDDISVFDLCARAGIRRATFYKHFEDKLDFLTHVIKKILDDMTMSVKQNYTLIDDPVEYITNYVKHIILFFDERGKLFNSIIASNSFPLVFDTVTTHTMELIKKNLDDAAMPKDSSRYQKIMTAEFINGGISTMLINWLRDRSISEERFLDQVRTLLCKLLF